MSQHASGHGRPAKRGIFVAPFDELAEPKLLVELAERAEDRGWDGLFLWDHVAYVAPVTALADPWIALAAIAANTSRLAIGPLVTPLARRRPHKLARETVSLDRLSAGRLVLGVGLGSELTREFHADVLGEEPDPSVRARLLDAGLAKLLDYWAGEFEPRPVSAPRIPIWVAARWPHRRPLKRAARFDGLFPIDCPSPDALASYAEEIASLVGSRAEPYEIVVTNPPGTDLEPWIAAGATWCLTGFGPQPRASDVRTAIDAAAQIQ